ncbi:Fc.00g115650.m01.CDS01 [Cosmosporella sp. VM-42]
MKITATIPPQVVVLPQGNHLLSSMTKLRNSETATKEFFDAFEIVSSQLIASALDSLPTEAVDVVTPTGGIFKGTKQVTHVCGVSILRAGASFETVLRNLYTGPLSFGKILIQRNEETSLPYHLYSNFPRGVAEMTVFLLEPMLATGASACMAVDKVRASGVPERNIVFVNLLASREGLSILTTRHPEMHVVTAAIDEELTASKHITPGLGDFGDRFYGTSN